ncbi:hypothetical protein [Paraflavitalea speifideaquila]|uniref:hypothetical protein n=1 Tax=Paraflavitalea speifideaquila TaxID=3076558 RepID=UPI0028F0CAC2|nr:hypothetical protein [Paraflavitalea speifideiaquila]
MGYDLIIVLVVGEGYTLCDSLINKLLNNQAVGGSGIAANGQVLIPVFLAANKTGKKEAFSTLRSLGSKRNCCV